MRDGLAQRSFVVRYLMLFGGEVGSKLCVLVAFAYLARALGPRDFGAIELALSTTIFFVLAAETGLGSYGARIVETNPERAGHLRRGDEPRVGPRPHEEQYQRRERPVTREAARGHPLHLPQTLEDPLRVERREQHREPVDREHGTAAPDGERHEDEVRGNGQHAAQQNRARDELAGALGVRFDDSRAI